MKNPENMKVLYIVLATAAVFGALMVFFRMLDKTETKEPKAVLPGITTSTEPEEIDDGMPDFVSTRTSLTGTYVDCLPLHDNFSEKICTPGFKTDDNKYYALDFNLMSQEKTELKAGDRFSANGLFTPIEMLSSDRWQGVAAAGIFSVTDSVKKE